MVMRRKHLRCMKPINLIGKELMLAAITVIIVAVGLVGAVEVYQWLYPIKPPIQVVDDNGGEC